MDDPAPLRVVSPSGTGDARNGDGIGNRDLDGEAGENDDTGYAKPCGENGQNKNSDDERHTCGYSQIRQPKGCPGQRLDPGQAGGRQQSRIEQSDFRAERSQGREDKGQPEEEHGRRSIEHRPADQRPRGKGQGEPPRGEE